MMHRIVENGKIVYVVSGDELSQILTDTVDLYIEYLQVHGRDQERAKIFACAETIEGIDASLDLQEEI